MAINWQPPTGTKYVLKTGSRFYGDHTHNSKQTRFKSSNVTQVHNSATNYIYHKVISGATKKIENINGNPWQPEEAPHATDTLTQYKQQKAMTKFIIGLQSQTTTQRFTSILGNLRTRIDRQTQVQNHNTPTGKKYIEQKGSMVIIRTTPTNNTE